MHFYGLDDLRVLEMPVRRFWLLSRNIDRIAAEFDLRAIKVSAAKTSEENFKSSVGDLQKQMGTVADFDRELDLDDDEDEPKLDRAGLAELKAMAQVMRGSG